MKPFIVSISLLLLFITPCYAQSKENESITVKSIRQVSKSQTKKEAGIEIELVTSDPKGFYIGGLYWCLQIGKLPGAGEGGFPHYTSEGKPLVRLSPNKTRLFGFTKDDWKKLKNGDPMRLTWGCPKNSDYEAIKPFAFLNKKILKK
jgi:hypothetical protein